VPTWGEYAIRQWSQTGALKRELVVDSDWYDGSREVRQITPSAPPMSVILAINEDSLGRLWVLGRAADARWREGLGPAQRVEHQTVYPFRDMDRLFDGVIEVIDVKSARVLARRRIDAWPSYWLSTTLVASYAEPETVDEPILRLHAVQFRDR
jgi:hypothetical protein